MNLIQITLASVAGLVLVAPAATAQTPVRTNERPSVERQARQKEAPGARGVERADEQRPAGERPNTERPAGERPNTQRPAGERPEARPEEKRPETRPEGRPEDKVKGMKDDVMVQKALREEAKHRERLAKVNRLRELATKEGDRDMLARLEALESTENSRYARMLADAKRILGEERFNQIKAQLEQGRGAQRPAPERPAGERPAPERPVPERPTKRP